MTDVTGTSAELTELVNHERLIQKRSWLHENLGRILTDLCRVEHERQECVADIIRTNEQLRQLGVDTHQIERDLYLAEPDAEIA